MVFADVARRRHRGDDGQDNIANIPYQSGCRHLARRGKITGGAQFLGSSF